MLGHSSNVHPAILKWVKIVVLKTMREKRLTHLDAQTLISAGHLGYVQSRIRFDASRGVKFKTFAEYRIKGAVLDEVRKMIGDERCKNKRPRQVEYDYSLIGEDKIEDIDSKLDVEKFFDSIPLSVKEKEILICRIRGMNLKEIGEKFGFSESRASQLLAVIKRQIYPWFRDYLGQNFKLVKRICPTCRYEIETAEFSVGFDCENCGADIVIVNSVAVIKESLDG